jgi:mRNA interferase MazF
MSVDWIGAELPDEPVILVPFTSSRAPSPLRPAAPDGLGLQADSVALCRAVRSVARSRLLERLGEAPPGYVDRVAQVVSALVGAATDAAGPPAGDSRYFGRCRPVGRRHRRLILGPWLALVLAAALAACTGGGRDREVASMGGGATAAPGLTQPEQAEALASCLQNAGIPAVAVPIEDDPSQVWVQLETSHASESRLPDGDYLRAFSTEEWDPDFDAEWEQLGDLTAKYTVEDQQRAGGGEMPPYLVIGRTDHTEAFTACLKQSGYSNPLPPPADRAEELRGKQGEAQASAAWAQCARDNGFPDTKDPAAPVADNYATQPTAVLPATIAEGDLRQLLEDCPPIDPTAEAAWEEARAAGGYQNPMSEAEWAELTAQTPYPYRPAIGFDYPGFRGDVSEPAGDDAELVDRLLALIDVKTRIVNSLEPPLEWDRD